MTCPCLAQGPWKSPDCLPELIGSSVDPGSSLGLVVKEISAGGDNSFVTVVVPGVEVGVYVCVCVCGGGGSGCVWVWMYVSVDVCECV